MPRKRRLTVDQQPEGKQIPDPYALPFHSSFSLNGIADKLLKYFNSLDIMLYREQFPAMDNKHLTSLATLRRGFRHWMWKNHSLIESTANPSPASWDNELRRVKIDPRLLTASSTAPLKQIARVSRSTTLRGFLMTACIVQRSNSKRIYTPIMGGWIAAASNEDFRDREFKGLFSWSVFPPLVQRELQLAFLMRLLIDAMWWKVTPDDRSGDSNRFVSMPIQDLALCPLETLEIIDQMEHAAQHYDPEGGPAGQHQIGKCKCSTLEGSTNTNLLLGASGLRRFLQDASNAKQRSQADPIFKSVFNGIPSIRVSQVVERVSSTLRPVLDNVTSTLSQSPSWDYESSAEELSEYRD
eukprot:Blabericola_migrator_1__10673@NODE_608_length_7306_cov_258_002348_g441_i0_p3_GENE_NODE_608_length_7306_cov_258_002348_g441_i0NODE_608_length_7306_cov_258_002348_g441_i0_p3_ORF_typecomplete_len354_score64_87_NODE_608_length_7306_cov_258_002348_g441_i036864747